MEESGEDEILGPGADLAFSFSGMLLVVAMLAVIQLWISAQQLLLIPELDKELAIAKAFSIAAGTENRQLRDRLAVAEDRLSKVPDVTRQRQSEPEEALRLAKEKAEAFRRMADQEKEAHSAALRKLRDAEAAVVTAAEALRHEGTKVADLEAKVLALGGRLARADASLDAERTAHNLTRLSAELARRLDERRAEDLKFAISRNDALNRQIAQMEQALRLANDKPPLLRVSDAGNVTIFQAGSAEPSEHLVNWLKSKAPELVESARKYSATVIEVIGHTDEVPVGATLQSRRNLDKALLEALNEREAMRNLGVCDNVGLGMARAAAVVAELNRLGMGNNLRIIPLSAGPVLEVDGTLAKGQKGEVGEAARRRIEIRLRRPN